MIYEHLSKSEYEQMCRKILAELIVETSPHIKLLYMKFKNIKSMSVH